MTRISNMEMLTQWLQVTALETRVLQLEADEEVATVTAGAEAQAAAAEALQQAQDALVAVDKVSGVRSSHRLHWQWGVHATMPCSDIAGKGLCSIAKAAAV
jgi:hypothetical protein